MATGTAKWFNNAKGFGFICPEEKMAMYLLITPPFKWTDIAL